MRKSIPLLALLILGSAFFASTSFAQNAAKWPLVNCATNTPCTANGPLNTHTGDSLPIAAYKLNTDIKQLALMFGSSSNLALNGSANASDIIGLWTNCTAGTPVLGYQGTCIAGGSGGSTAFQANGTALTSSSTVNFENSAATNGLTLTFSNPSAGNVQLGLSGTLTNAGLANSSVTLNGQAISLGGSGNVNSGAAQYSIALNGAAGAAIGGMTLPGATGTYCIDYASLTANPTFTTCPGAGGGAAFSALTSGTNTTAAMEVGTGASLTYQGGTAISGAINADDINGASVPASASVLSSNASSQLAAATTTGSGSVVLSTSPTLVTPALGTPSSVTLTNGTGLPVSTGISGLGTGVATALATAIGSAGSPVVNGGALGTPSSGVGTNITGVDAATLGGATFAAPGAIGGTTPGSGAFTTLSASGAITSTLATGTAPFVVASTTNVANLNASSVLGYTLPCTVPTLVSGEYLTNNGTTCDWAAAVTSFSFTNGGGLSGSVATATTTPALSLTPSFSGIAYATSGTGFAAATAANILATVNTQTCNAQTGTTYTFALSDANNCVTMSNTAANTVTVPANATVAFPVGTTLTVIQVNTGATTLEGAGSPVTLDSAKYGSSTTQTYVFPAEYSCISLQQTATNVWFVSECDYNPGGGSGTVTDGAGTTTANELAVSTTTAHVLGYAATLPTAAMPALTGDLTGTAGSLSVTVSKVNSGAIPASAATGACTNASSQFTACSDVTYLIDSGTAFTLGTGTGACATDSVVHAGAANGEVTCTGTTGASTLVVNLPTTTNAWACTATDITQKAMIPESAFTTTSVTFSGSVTASDDIMVACTGF